MALLKTKVSLYLQGNSTTWDNEKNNLELRNKGNGTNDYIHTWEVQGVSKPTQAQLDALETQANDYEFNLGQIAKRKAEYGSAESQMENIIENGLEAEQLRIQSIKDKYPKR